MEQEILEIIKKIIAEKEIARLINDNAYKFEYPINYNKITFNALTDFNNKHFNKYKNCLLKNAAIYAIKNKDNNYINTFNKINISYLINNDDILKALITKYAYFNIYNKINNNINYDKEIIENNKFLFCKLTYINELNTITNLYRKTILDFINKFDEYELEYILDDFLFTNKYDKEFITNNNIISIKNIYEFKSILIRIILSDTYLELKSLEKDEEFDIYLDSINKKFNNNDDDYETEFEKDETLLNELDNEILNLLENNINKLLNKKDLRLYTYTKFIMYNLFFKEHKYDIENISDDTKAIKKLKKINPFYFLDYID